MERKCYRGHYETDGLACGILQRDSSRPLCFTYDIQGIRVFHDEGFRGSKRQVRRRIVQVSSRVDILHKDSIGVVATEIPHIWFLGLGSSSLGLISLTSCCFLIHRLSTIVVPKEFISTIINLDIKGSKGLQMQELPH